MYQPEIFQESRQDVLIDFIQQHPLATLIHFDGEEIIANHIPMQLLTLASGELQLIGHIAKTNPLHTNIANNSPTLAIFQAENAYISPNWYPNKLVHHQHVPTWNYQVVHVRGKIEFSHDEKQIRGILAKLTRQHEATQAKPWKMSQAPKDYITNQIQQVVAITLSVDSMIGKFKLSQNRDAVDFQGAVNGLKDIENTEIAEEMGRHYQTN